MRQVFFIFHFCQIKRFNFYFCFFSQYPKLKLQGSPDPINDYSFRLKDISI